MLLQAHDSCDYAVAYCCDGAASAQRLSPQPMSIGAGLVRQQGPVVRILKAQEKNCTPVLTAHKHW